jgi:hypothetical protein
MDGLADYAEQFCDFCRDETDQAIAADSTVAKCLRCGKVNPVKAEEDRVSALLERVKEDHATSINQLRDATVPF